MGFLYVTYGIGKIPLQETGMAEQSSPSTAAKVETTGRSLLGYLLMSFLTAANDNMFRWLIVPIAKYQYGNVPGLTVEEKASNESFVLALGLASFIIPSIIFATWSGWVADRFSKRSSIVYLKMAELVIMALGMASIWFGNMSAMFVVLFLTGAQSALLSTAKFGLIPELVPREGLSRLNGLMGLITLLAVIGGTVAGNFLYAATAPDGRQAIWISALIIIGTSVLGIISAFIIPKVKAANPGIGFPWNPIRSSLRDLRLLFADRAILRVTLGIAFFWSLAALAQINIDTFVINSLYLDQTSVGIFLAVLSIGVGFGSVLAGRWSEGRVELGMVPLGAAIMAAACLLAYFSASMPIIFGISLLAIGTGGGLFNVPLNSFVQDRSPHQFLGAILAAGNQITSIGILGVSILFPILMSGLGTSPAQVFLLAGIGTLPILIYTVALIPQATLRFVVWLLSKTVYRVRTFGSENIPATGSALIVANHVSWIDGILLLLTSPRPIRMIAYADYCKGPILKRLAKLFDVIPIKATDGPRALMQSITSARNALKSGDLVCIFAEGSITRTGELQEFERGMLKILKGTHAPVLPVYLDELWGSIFSYEGGRFFWKKPKHWPYPITVQFGPLIDYSDVTDVDIVRDRVLSLKSQCLTHRKEIEMIPALRFVKECRSSWGRQKVADSAGTELTGGRLLTSVFAFRKLLVDSVLTPEDEIVGLFVPPSAGGAIANLAMAVAGKVTANLNYTLTEEVVNFCIQEAGIKTVITSKAFMEKRPMKLNAKLVYLEDLKTQIGGLAKIKALLAAKFKSLASIETSFGLSKLKPDDLMTIIFTSGSTGEPKGVMLSHANINSNLDAVNEMVELRESDTLLGVLPFFHSFGYTITLWLPATCAPAAVYHYNPLESRVVAKLTSQYKATILTATPTFLRSYMKRCSADDMASMNLVIVGAEKMPPELRQAWKDKYGYEPSEGYGTTELSPLASVNVPDNRMQSPGVGTRHGTVGRAIPGTTAQVFHADSDEPLGMNVEGILKIKGPNVMLGYLNKPEKTTELIQDGWYNTGDMAKIDDDGFIEITGRQSRFSKIGGEMVPHIRIEQELSRILDDDLADEPEVLCAVTAVPSAKKGERLIVLHKACSKPIPQAINELKACGLPNLWLPSQDSFLELEQIPLLGSGKLDLKAVKEVAMKHFG